MPSVATVAREYGPPIVLGLGLATLVAGVVSVVRHGYSSPAAFASFAALFERAAAVAKIDDRFVPFSLAVAHRESRFNPKALNTSSANNACELYDASSEIFANNPYPRSDFCIGAGGIFGFFPATGLKAKGFRNLDPALIFDPVAATAMFADFVHRIVVGYFDKLSPSERNWLSIRRAMAGLEVMYDGDSSQRGREVEARLAEDLRAIGADPDLMYDRPNLGSYPGATTVWTALRAA